MRLSKETLLTAGWMVVCTFLAVSFVSAAQSTPPELVQALGEFNRGNYADALDIAQEYLDRNPASTFAASAEVLAGRAEVKLGFGMRAADRARRILRVYPDSPLDAQAYYLLATAYQSLGEHFEAARALVNCLDHNPDADLENEAEERLSELAEGPAHYKAYLLRDVAEADATQDYLSRYFSERSKNPVLGIVVPGMDDQDSTSLAMVRGIEAAVAAYNTGDIAPASFQVRSHREEPVDAVLQTRSLIRDSGAWGIVLGGEYETVIAAAVEATAAGVPVMIPGMRRPGFHTLGHSTVQVEADWYREGEIAALYAADSLNLRRFVIIAPATSQCKENVAGFTDVLARRDSIEILAEEWYFPEEGVNLRKQFLRLRDAAFRCEYRDFLQARADTVENYEFDSMMVEQGWEKWRKSIMEELDIDDPADIELSSIDAMYCPIEGGSMELVAPQLAFYNLHTQWIGNSAWYNESELYRHRDYVQGMILPGSYYLKDDNSQLEYLRKWLGDHSIPGPTAWQVRGFDAARVLLAPVRQGVIGPQEITEIMDNLKRLSLASGRQIFDPKRHIGVGMWLLTVQDGFVREEDTELRRIRLETKPQSRQIREYYKSRRKNKN